LIVIAVINLMFGFLTPGIDNWAHMGGLVGGFAVAFPLVPNYRRQLSADLIQIPSRPVDANSLARRWWVVPLALLVLAAGTRLGTATLADHPVSHLQNAERLLLEESYDLALHELTEAIRIDPLIGEAYYMRGRILAETGDARGAVSDLAHAVRLSLDPDTRRDAVSLLLVLGSGP
jgi:tetratricopeptide (TPR) repeat protein